MNGLTRQPLHERLKTPLLVKIAPDLADEDIQAVAQLALAYHLDGIVATNSALASDVRRILRVPVL